MAKLEETTPLIPIPKDDTGPIEQEVVDSLGSDIPTGGLDRDLDPDPYGAGDAADRNDAGDVPGPAEGTPGTS
jgi:hypothetical protein